MLCTLMCTAPHELPPQTELSQHGMDSRQRRQPADRLGAACPKAQRLSLNPDIPTTSASLATGQECGTWSSDDPTPRLRDHILKPAVGRAAWLPLPATDTNPTENSSHQ